MNYWKTRSILYYVHDNKANYVFQIADSNELKLLGGSIEPEYNIVDTLCNYITEQTSNAINRENIESVTSIDAVEYGSYEIYPYFIKLNESVHTKLYNVPSIITFKINEVLYLLDKNTIDNYYINEMDRKIFLSLSL